MSTFSVFESVTMASGKIAKTDVLKKLTPLQKELFTWAMDPGRVYFVRVDENNLPATVGTGNEETLINMVRAGLDRLRLREVTGTSATTLVDNLLRSCQTELQQKWIARIINKDLRVGVDTAFHKLYPDAYDVFEPQLCLSWDDEPVDGWFYEGKWNGLRVLGVPNEANVHGWFSRNGKPVPGMDALTEELANARMPNNGHFAFDGEGFGGDWDDQVGQSVSKIRGNKNLEDITFNIFDMVEAAEWQAIAKGEKGKTPLAQRRSLLEMFFTMNPQLKKLKLVEQGKINYGVGITPTIARDEAISKGLEGIIIKNPKGVYHPGKHSNGWYKFKKRHPADVTITGAVEGTKDCKGMLGAIIVEGAIDAFDKHGKPMGSIIIAATEIGTGFTRDQRREFWELHNKGELAGLTAEVEWGEITKDKKLFHTAFKRLRFDK
jgi:ATP-dependent DNA ligase